MKDKIQLETLKIGMRKIMDETGLDSKEIATAGGVSYGHYRNILSGKYPLKLNAFMGLSMRIGDTPSKMSTKFVYEKIINGKSYPCVIIFSNKRRENEGYDEIVFLKDKIDKYGYEYFEKLSENKVRLILLEELMNHYDEKWNEYYKSVMYPFNSRDKIAGLRPSLIAIVEELYEADEDFLAYVLEGIKRTKQFVNKKINKSSQSKGKLDLIDYYSENL